MIGVRQTFESRVNWPLGAALTLVVITIGARVLALGGAIVWVQARRRAERAR